MSRYSSKVGVKPHCKVCQDSGLPDSVYSNHNTRGPGGKVTCITLLNAKCSNCNKSGHTKKFCTVPEKTHNKPKPYNTPPSAAPKNSFASFVSDDDSSEDDEPVKKKVLEMDWAAFSDDEEEEPAEFLVRIKRNLSKEY